MSAPSPMSAPRPPARAHAALEGASSAEPEPAAARELPLRDAIEAAGGARGVLLNAVPTVALLTGNSLGGVGTGLIAAAVAAVVVVGVQLVLGIKLRAIAGGVIGVAIALALVARSGRPETFFLPGILNSSAQSALVLLSCAIGKPVLGYAAEKLGAIEPGWRERPGELRLYRNQSLALAGLLGGRAGISAVLYGLGALGALGVFKITAVPMQLGFVALCVRWSRSGLARLERAAGLESPSAPTETPEKTVGEDQETPGSERAA